MEIVADLFFFLLSTGILCCSNSTAFAFSHSYSVKQADVADWGNWQAGRAAYDTQLFSEALQEFQKNPKEEFSYYYNLGNIYYRLKEWGRALAYFEKANRLNPHDPDIQHNLALVRGILAQNLGSDALDPVSNWMEQLIDRISLDETRTTLGLLGFILVLLWIRSYHRQKSALSLKKIFFRSESFFGMFCFSLALLVYAIQQYTYHQTPAICLESQKIHSGPGSQYLQLGLLEAGVKVRLLPGREKINESETWQKVRFFKGKIGWVKAPALLEL